MEPPASPIAGPSCRTSPVLVERSATKARILVLVGHYLPGFRAGGPLRSIANLVDQLGDRFDFRILTADRDLGDNHPFPAIKTDRWVPLERAQVHYTSPQAQTLGIMARIIRDMPHDLIYLNSFFAPRFTILPLLARRLGLIPRRPLLLAPRGEFSPGALALKKTKKQVYLALARRARLLGDLRWQASSSREADDIRAVIGDRAEIRIACDLAAPLPRAPSAFSPRAAGAPLRVVFLARISPMKNLDYALDVLARVRSPVVFSIFGPAEDAAYLAVCRDRAAKLPANISVMWGDTVRPQDVPATLAAHDLFFLPTRGENFGHVIAESLAAGTPVLLSDTTPWRQLADHGVGEELPLSDPARFAAQIEEMAAEPAEAALARRTRAAAYARRRQHDGGDLAANLELLGWALAHNGASI